jgi:integrase
MKLNDIQCKNLKPKERPYKATDGDGMYLEIMPNGGKYWRMNYRFLGKQKRLAFGVYPKTTIKEARKKRDEAKKMLESGKDPSELKKLSKLQIATNYENSFETLAREWHKQRIHSWKPKHGANILKRLETYILPSIGYRPIKEITQPEILAALRKVEAKENYELAHRLLQSCSQVFRYGVATGRASRDITTDLKGALKPVKSKHHAYLGEKELPGFLQELEQYDTKYNGYKLTKIAFKLLILTFVRSVEIRAAKWEEFDFDKAEWKIPAKRMKMGTPHIVPLAKQSILLLKEAKEITGEHYSNFVFPSNATPLNCMSENTFLRAIELMGYKGQTVGHGFRATASTILNESGRFNSDLIERQLAHCERDQVRGAYNYAQYLSERAKMMQWYADKIDQFRYKK